MARAKAGDNISGLPTQRQAIRQGLNCDIAMRGDCHNCQKAACNGPRKAYMD